MGPEFKNQGSVELLVVKKIKSNPRSAFNLGPGREVPVFFPAAAVFSFITELSLSLLVISVTVLFHLKREDVFQQHF